MDNLIKFNLESCLYVTLRTAEQLAKDLGMYHVNEITLFSALVLNTENQFHRSLMAKGFTDLELAQTVNTLFTSNREKLYQKTDCKKWTFLFKGENGKDVQENYLISVTLVEAIEMYLNGIYGGEISSGITVTAIDLLKIYVYYFPIIYSDYMDIYFEALKENEKRKEQLEKSKKKAVNETILPYELQSFLTVLNNKYSPYETECPILMRDKETSQLIKILAKANKRNSVLIGEPGVGKTALVEKLAWMITTGNCHEKFKDSKIIVLDVNSVIAGTKFRGMAEQRFQDLIKFLEDNKNYILFIDEVHTILGAGACVDGEMDLANSLKPILARGDTQVIGATTLNEYEKYFSKDGALKRRFEKVFVNEPRSDEVYPMIKNQIARLEKFHGVKISKKMVDFAILNAACFNYETKNPDRTLDLIDRSMAGAELLGHKKVTQSDIMDNFEIHMEQFENATEAQKKAIAYHEAGHFIVRKFSEKLNDRKTLAISIMPAEGYYGVNVMEVDNKAMPYDNYSYFIQTIAALMGGRWAENMFTSELSAGAREDLKTANKIARDMVTNYALVEDFSISRIYAESEDNFRTDKINNQIDSAIRKILDEAEAYAKNILNVHRAELEILVSELMHKGIINQKEIEELFNDYPKEV